MQPDHNGALLAHDLSSRPNIQRKAVLAPWRTRFAILRPCRKAAISKTVGLADALPRLHGLGRMPTKRSDRWCGVCDPLEGQNPGFVPITAVDDPGRQAHFRIEHEWFGVQGSG